MQRGGQAVLAALVIGLLIGAAATYALAAATLSRTTTTTTALPAVTGTSTTTVTVGQTSQAVASSSAAIEGASCLTSVPTDAMQTMSEFSNSTFNGDEITYANGTQRFFSYYSCPRPTSAGSSVPGLNNGFDAYSLAVTTVTNSTFIAAENGSQYLFLESEGIVCSPIQGPEICNVGLVFIHYGASQNLTTSGGLSIYWRLPVSGLVVSFNTTNRLPVGEGCVPGGSCDISNSTAWYLQDPQIQVIPPDQLLEFWSSSSPR
jgi:hypothetical protein